MIDDPEAHLVDNAITDQEPRSESKWLRAMLTGQMQMGPGQPLLPATYRGGDDWLPVVRHHIVSRGEELIAAFTKRLDAERWTAWCAAERKVPVTEFTIRSVVVMAVRKAGPLFDDEQGPSGTPGHLS
jgi:hypothetical protein